MQPTTPLLEAIGAARMAIFEGLEDEVEIHVSGVHVRVWREGQGIEGIKVAFPPHS